MLGAMKKRRRSSAQWRVIVQQQRASGLSIAAFCRRAKVPQASFYAWRRRLHDAVRFAEVKIVPASAGAASASGIELRLPGPRCVVVHPGFDRRTLLDLLAALEGQA